MKMEYNLKGYRPFNTTSFIGRQQGEDVRKKLDLEKLDQGDYEVFLTLPADTTSFNPSFYLGLLYHSIKALGKDVFSSRYHFSFEETTAEGVKAVLQRNLDDGFRNALNSMDDKTGIKVFGL